MTEYSISPEFLELVKSTEKLCKPKRDAQRFPRTLYRHRDNEGYLVHIPLVYRVETIFNTCRQQCASEDVLELDDSNLLKIRFLSGTPVRLPSNVVPILAGQHRNGQENFVASEWYLPYYIEVAEEATLENVENFGVELYILRYVPSTYLHRCGSNELTADLGSGLDSTGSYSWKFLRYRSRIKEPSDTLENTEDEIEMKRYSANVTEEEEFEIGDDEDDANGDVNYTGVHIYSIFWEIGGNSITAIKIVIDTYLIFLVLQSIKDDAEESMKNEMEGEVLPDSDTESIEGRNGRRSLRVHAHAEANASDELVSLANDGSDADDASFVTAPDSFPSS